MANWNSIKALETGVYEEIIARVKPGAAGGAADIVALIGAFAFLGRVEEASEIWNNHRGQLQIPDRIRCRFFLGVALTRTARFRQGRKYFEANLADKTRAETALPFVYQGSGFYCYFVGQFAKARKWSRRAIRSSMALENEFLRFLSLDLMGHCLVQIGSRSEGLRLIHLGQSLAEKHGNRNFAAAFNSSSLIYEAEIGRHPDSIIKKLTEMIRNPQSKDSYTRSNLILELSRQLSLRGRWKEAKDLLDRESSLIYEFGNRRQEFFLQMRFAEIAFRQGDRFGAEHFLRSGKRCLLDIADRAFEVKALGFELKLKKQNSQAISPGLITRLKALSIDHSSLLHRQILFRQELGDDPGTSEAEDPLNHLFQQALLDPGAAAERALELGYLGLWPEFMKIPPGQSFFWISPRNRSFVIGSPEQIVYRTEKLSPQNLKLLEALAAGLSRKDQLVKAIWGYDYHPLRHDSLIHRAMSQLRKHFEPFGSWLLTTESGWALNPQVRWIRPQAASLAQAQPALESDLAVAEATAGIAGLNFRQMQLLEKLRRQNQIWSIPLYKKNFKVSTMTAFRDLKGLCDLGYLKRSGQARSTRYHYLDSQSAE